MGRGEIWLLSQASALGPWPGFQLFSLVSLQLEQMIIVQFMHGHQEADKSLGSLGALPSVRTAHGPRRGLAHRSGGSLQSQI